MSHPLHGLPDAMRAVAPEIWEAPWHDEVLATCGDCAMTPRTHLPPSAHRIVFTAKARCCTYQPELPNYLVGSALRRGGVGAEKVRARLADPDGRSVFGLRPPAAWRKRYREQRNAGTGFGKDDALTCPYWQEGRYGCSIHLDRESVCRTWFCRTTHGARAGHAWAMLREALTAVEDSLAVLLAQGGTPPADDAPVERWEAWFVDCASRLEALSPEQIAEARVPKVVSRNTALAAAVENRDRPLPELVMPSVQQWFPEGESWWMTAWSAFDLVQVPKWIFALLSRFDGRTPWREVVRATEEAIGEPIPDDLVLTLWRRGLLTDPAELDAQPGWKIRLVNTPGSGDGERWETEIVGLPRRPGA